MLQKSHSKNVQNNHKSPLKNETSHKTPLTFVHKYIITKIKDFIYRYKLNNLKHRKNIKKKLK